MKNSELKLIRKKLKQSQSEFSETIGKSLRQVQYYESGKIEIPRHIQKFVKLIQEKMKITLD